MIKILARGDWEALPDDPRTAASACFFCGTATERHLMGDASYGTKRGTFRIPVCANCWENFEATGSGTDTDKLEVEITRQVMTERPH